MTTQGAILIANILWFGMFFVCIFYAHWTPAALIVPLLLHWVPEDFESKK